MTVCRARRRDWVRDRGFIGWKPYDDSLSDRPLGDGERVTCEKCNGTGKIKRVFSGPSFPSALVIMDRRGL